MKNMGIIQCSTVQAIPLIIGKDTVYVHTDIKQILVDGMGESLTNLWECNEVQYDKDEYLTMMDEKNRELNNQVSILEIKSLLEREIRLSTKARLDILEGVKI